MEIHPSYLKAGDVFVASFNVVPMTCMENFIDDLEGLTVLVAGNFTWVSLVGVESVERIQTDALHEVLAIK